MIDRRGQMWTLEHERFLIQHLEADDTLILMCTALGRTPAAILAKLCDLGYLVAYKGRYHRIDPDPWVTDGMLGAASAEWSKIIKAHKAKEPK